MQINKPKISKRSIFKSFIWIFLFLNIVMLVLYFDVFQMKLNDEKNFVKESQKSILNLYMKITQDEILTEVERDVDLLITAYNFERKNKETNFKNYLDTYIRTSRKYVGLEILGEEGNGIIKLPEITDDKIAKIIKKTYNTNGEPVSIVMYYDLYELIKMFNEYEKLTSDTLYFLKANGEDLNQKRNHPPFKEKYTNAWSEIDTELSGNFENENGIFSFITFPTLQSAKFEAKEMENWILVIRYSDTKIRNLINRLLYERYVAVKYAEIPIFLISLQIAYLFARRKSLYTELQNTAIYDSLTSVYNRNGGLNLLEETRKLLKRSKEPISLCYVNIVGIRNINSRHGHDEGDATLVKAAEIFSELIRESDAVVRIGGDEFLLIFPRCKESEQSIIEGRLITKVQDYNATSGKGYELSLKYGFTELTPYNMDPISKIMKTSERHMTKKI